MPPQPRLPCNGPPSQSRPVTISKSLSWLLRHGASKERINMTSDGYVSVSELLNWPRLKSLNADFAEVIAAVRENEKQRFALLYRPVKDGGVDANADADGESANQKALRMFNTDQDASRYFIRATQGHSLKTLDTAAYLKPITLESCPESVVHGTFLKFWPAIVKSGGLKAMSRVHVHFASGPSVENLGLGEGGENAGGMQVWKRKGGLKTAMEKGHVVSGMRKDAEVLIYVDVKRALEAGMEWFVSDNAVILTEGVVRGEKKAKMVPVEFWDVVVEVGQGLGVVWRRGDEKELPRDLLIREPTAMGGKPGRWSGKTKDGPGRPKLLVERDDLGAEEA